MVRKYPAVLTLVFVGGGILFADVGRLPNWMLLVPCLAFCLAGFALLNQPRKAFAAAAFGCSLFFFSAFHYSVKYCDVGPNHVANVAVPKQVYHIFGRVSDWPDLKVDRTEIKVSLDSIADGRTHRVSGIVLLKVSDTTTALQRGDRVELYGRIYPVVAGGSSASFDYRRFLNLKGVFGIVYLPTLLNVRVEKGYRYGMFNLIDRLRSSIRNSLCRNLSPTAAALASGFLIGETRDIPANIYVRFRDSGTLHLLAVSGSNVALVLGFAIILLLPFSISRKRRALVLLVVILVFDLLSYGEPSVMRASTMAALVILAGLVERRYDLNNVIASAAVIIMLFDPAQLFDVGFQLSFVIAWGLIFIVPRLNAYFTPYHNRRWYRWLMFPFMITVVAQLASMGLIAFYFHRIPIISPIANLFVVPLVSIAVIGIMMLLLADLILPLLGAFVGSFVNALLGLVLWLVELMGGESIPMVKIADLSPGAAAIFYLYLFLVVWSLNRKVIRRVIVISALILANIVLLVAAVQAGGDKAEAEINMFSIPGGVAAVVDYAPDSSVDLVITGISAKKYQVEERVIYPNLDRLRVRRINTLFVLSADYDALDDLLRLVEKYQVSAVCHHKRLEKSFADAMRMAAVDTSRLNLTVFGDNRASPKKPGYYPSKLGLLARFKSACVMFSNQFYSEHFDLQAEKEKQFLVIGKTWQACAADWTELHTLGYSKIICSRVEQANRLSVSDEKAPFPAESVPHFIYDLNRMGPLRLSLREAY